MATMAEEVMLERRAASRSAARQRANFLIFLGPAIVLTVLFFVIPVIIDVAVSFTDLGRSLKITGFTLEQYQKVFHGDRRLSQVIVMTFIYVFGTLAIFNVTFGLILALVTTSISRVSGSFFRGVWLMPRMSPSVLYILLWLWVVDPSSTGLLNQVLINGFSLSEPLDLKTSGAGRAHHHRQRLHRRVAGHDHLHVGNSRHTGASLSCSAGRRCGHPGADLVHHPAGVALADQLRDHLPDAVASGQLRVHPSAYQGRPLLRYDRLRALYLPARF